MNYNYSTLYDIGLLETLCFTQSDNVELWFLENNTLVWSSINHRNERVYLKYEQEVK